jgi:hypothetical protein
LEQSGIRLEVLKLAVAQARSIDEIQARAKTYEAYVLHGNFSVETSDQDAGAEAQKGAKNSEAEAPTDKRSQKKSDNLKSLL